MINNPCNDVVACLSVVHEGSSHPKACDLLKFLFDRRRQHAIFGRAWEIDMREGVTLSHVEDFAKFGRESEIWAGSRRRDQRQRRGGESGSLNSWTQCVMEGGL